MTPPEAAPPPEPYFIDGPAGPLFAIYHPPSTAVADGGDLIYVPPFAEELNRTRRMAALQVRALAKAGVGALIVDLYGTGDSGGDFRDARWETWLGDIAAAAGWLDSRGRRRIGLWGLRVGALLAATAAADDPKRYNRVILWQPAISGERALTQFLRVRVAAGMGAGNDGETTKDLRARFADGAGDSLEVAGYEVPPQLAAAIDGARIGPLGSALGMPVDWFEVVSESGRPPAPASRKVWEEWRNGGVPLTTATVVGEPFWNTQEIAVAPALIEATSALFGPAEP